MSFQDLGLAQAILRAITAEGYSSPTPIQSEAIPHIFAGRDLIGCAQTGTGKTAAFALPILHRLVSGGNPPRGGGRRIRVLALAPTRELAAQIGESFRTYGRFTALRHTVVFGGVRQFSQVRALQKGVDVLVATPGRLLDLMNQKYIDLSSVESLVLDEADRMLDMGFLPDLRRVLAALPAKRQTIFFSATMPPAIEQLANANLRDPVRIRIAPSQTTTEQIDESVCFVSQPQKTPLLLQLLTTNSITRALVFTRTKHSADRVAKHLIRSGISAEAMHGDKSQAARQRTLSSFKSNRPPVLVATDVAARGIDVAGISHVFNYDLPLDPETYVHRIGRTGRAGAVGCAVSFCDRTERGSLRTIERTIRRSLKVEAVGLFTDAEAAKDYSTVKAKSPKSRQAGRTSRFKNAERASNKPHASRFGRKKRRKASATS